MFTGVKAIIFDMDDTLYPEEQYVLSGFRAVSDWAEETLGIPSEKGFAQLKTMFEQGVRGNTFNLFLAEHGIDEQAMVERMLSVYREHKPHLRLFPQVKDLVAKLSERFKLGLVSDGYLEVQEKKWKALALEHYFAAVIFSDIWGREHWKPNPRPYLEAMSRCGTSASETIYVGDNPNKDFLGAKELGIGTVMVRRPGGVYSGIQSPSSAHGADAEITGLTELLNLIDHE